MNNQPLSAEHSLPLRQERPALVTDRSAVHGVMLIKHWDLWGFADSGFPVDVSMIISRLQI
ncbi:hypothetical protein [Nitrosospira briensis]|uniref:hypothetical protein n=1 Tax=Nitrosospira briensis TaxID=35799 RepID=UPI0009454D70|nr:hypothetical protein [Nitrosospira briensis]